MLTCAEGDAAATALQLESATNPPPYRRLVGAYKPHLVVGWGIELFDLEHGGPERRELCVRGRERGREREREGERESEIE
jgi:hypothetical protein